MNITWIKKEKNTGRKSNSDITINVTKSGAYITMRNGYLNEISPETKCIMVGVDNKEKNRLLFMAADSHTGWKFFKGNKDVAEGTMRCMLSGEKMRTLLARFAGDYAMELYEESGTALYCIDRRNILG